MQYRIHANVETMHDQFTYLALLNKLGAVVHTTYERNFLSLSRGR